MILSDYFAIVIHNVQTIFLNIFTYLIPGNSRRRGNRVRYEPVQAEEDQQQQQEVAILLLATFKYWLNDKYYHYDGYSDIWLNVA